jgi:transporter family protein
LYGARGLHHHRRHLRHRHRRHARRVKTLIFDLERPPLLWAIAGGLALTVAVSSLFHALSLGPANVVVPIYGMFIVGGSLLGVLFLEEPMSWDKIAGLIAAVVGVILISI